MGVALDEDYTGGSCRLTHGDVFIFFTDGVYEAFSPHGEEFGMKRLEAIMRESIHLGLEAIVGNVRQAVNDFTEHEPLRDDICILGMEVTEDPEIGAAR
jgi:sigma-B regulation protein RsbU (phosphoserine phosphatase)